MKYTPRMTSLALLLLAACSTPAVASTQTTMRPPASNAQASAQTRPTTQPATAAPYEVPVTLSAPLPGVTASLLVRTPRVRLDPTVAGLRTMVDAGAAGQRPATRADLVLRVRNTGTTPVSIRTGGDDEEWTVAVRGPGAVGLPRMDPCPEYYALGRWNVVAPGATVDLPLAQLVSGPRCRQTAYYLTAAGDYTADVTLRAHFVRGPAAAPSEERGTSIEFRATGVRLHVEP